jgi:hypothetical protein
MAIMARWRWPPESWCGKGPWRGVRARGCRWSRQRLDGAVPGLLLGQALLQLQHLGDLVADRVQRVQRRHRLLEDHRDVAAADARSSRSEAASAGRGCRPPTPAKIALPVTSAFCTSRSRLSAVTVLPEPDSPTSASFSPGRDVEIDAVHDFLAAEGDAQVLHVQQFRIRS